MTSPLSVLVRRAWCAVAVPALLWTPAAYAQEGAQHESEPLNLTGMVVVAALAIVVPLLFVVVSRMSQLRGEEEGEEIEPVVAGIGQGRAAVPRWLYLVYVVIPVWAGFYLINGQQVKGELLPPTPEPTAAPERTAGPTKAPSGGGSEVTIVAKDIKFDKSQLSLPAAKPVKVTLDNKDPATPHNFAIYTDSSLATVIFKGRTFNGPAKEPYSFTAPAAGSYFFQCDTHPTTMSGTVTVA